MIIILNNQQVGLAMKEIILNFAKTFFVLWIFLEWWNIADLILFCSMWYKWVCKITKPWLLADYLEFLSQTHFNKIVTIFGFKQWNII